MTRIAALVLCFLLSGCASAAQEAGAGETTTGDGTERADRAAEETPAPRRLPWAEIRRTFLASGSGAFDHTVSVADHVTVTANGAFDLGSGTYERELTVMPDPEDDTGTTTWVRFLPEMYFVRATDWGARTGCWLALDPEAVAPKQVLTHIGPQPSVPLVVSAVRDAEASSPSAQPGGTLTVKVAGRQVLGMLGLAHQKIEELPKELLDLRISVSVHVSNSGNVSGLELTGRELTGLTRRYDSNIDLDPEVAGLLDAMTASVTFRDLGKPVHVLPPDPEDVLPPGRLAPDQTCPSNRSS